MRSSPNRRACERFERRVNLPLGMQLTGLGPRVAVLLLAALAAACARAAPAPASPVVLPATPAFSPAAALACPLTSKAVWLPGAEQLLSYCDTILELRDAASGLVRAQKVTNTRGPLDFGIQGVALSPDGARVALSSYAHVELRELPSLNRLWSADVPANSLVFSADGQQIRVTDDPSALAFSVADGRRVPASFPNVAKRWQNSPALNADGSLGFEVEGTQLTVWDPRKDVALRSFELPKPAYQLPTWVGPYLCFRSADERRLVDTRDPKRSFSLKGVSVPAEVALSSDGSRVRSWRQGEVLEWRLGEAKPTVLSAASPRAVWLGPAGIRVESADDTLTLWRQNAEGERVAHHYWARPSWVEISPTGQVVANDSLRPRLLLLGGAAAEREITFPVGEEPILLAFEPGGGRFVSATSRKLRVYQEQTLALQQTIELPFVPSILAWRAEPAGLLVGNGGRVFSVALDSGQVTPFGDFTLAFRIAVSVNGKDVAILALHGGKPELTLFSGASVAHPALESMPLDARFSPDGKALWVLEQGQLTTHHLPLATGPTEQAQKRPIIANAQARLSSTGEAYTMSDRLRFESESGELIPEPEPAALLQPSWSAQGLTLMAEARRQALMRVSFPAGTAAEPAPGLPAKAPEMPQLPVSSGEVRAWVVNQDRSVLAALAGNGSVNTFSMKGGLQARLSESASALIGSEDASSVVIVAGDARGLSVWDTRTWQPRIELPVANGISALAVSKDGARVAVLNEHGALEVVSADRSLRHYDLRQDIAVRGLTFDPSGQYLALGGLPLRILRLADGALLYGYATSSERKGPIALAWFSDSGAVTGDLRALHALPFPSPSTPGAFLDTASFAKRHDPKLLEAFFGHVRSSPPQAAPKGADTK